jgi:N-acetylglucosaminyldiphosphoundecaprenol N-acetyl-beta-D-mannosaminyltransferase
MNLTILGVRIDPVTEEEAVERICAAVGSPDKYRVSTVNPEFVMEAQRNPAFMDALSKSNLNVPDGIGILWAANLLAYTPPKAKGAKVLAIWIIAVWYGIKTFLSLKFRTANVPQQVSGSNLVQSVARRAAAQNASLFLLGERPGVAEAAARNLQTSVPGLKITSTFAGDGSSDGDSQTVAAVSREPADILLVAYGAPKQEFWVERNLERVPCSVAIGVGGTFRFLAGDIRRAPAWIRRLGFEWLFRLVLEPWRWRRQLALPHFVVAVVREKIARS